MPRKLQLFNAMQEGLTRMEAVRTTFDELKAVDQKRKAKAQPVEEIAGLLTSASLPLSQEEIEAFVDHRIKSRQKGAAATRRAGYTGLLLVQSERALVREAKTWAEREDVQAFIGQKITIASLDPKNFVASSVERPALEYMGRRGGMSSGYPSFKPFEITGSVTEASVLGLRSGGTIALEAVEFSIDDPINPVVGRSGDTAVVKGLFAIDNHYPMPAITPQVKMSRG